MKRKVFQSSRKNGSGQQCQKVNNVAVAVTAARQRMREGKKHGRLSGEQEAKERG